MTSKTERIIGKVSTVCQKGERSPVFKVSQFTQVISGSFTPSKGFGILTAT